MAGNKDFYFLWFSAGPSLLLDSTAVCTFVFACACVPRIVCAFFFIILLCFFGHPVPKEFSVFEYD